MTEKYVVLASKLCFVDADSHIDAVDKCGEVIISDIAEFTTNGKLDFTKVFEVQDVQRLRDIG